MDIKQTIINEVEDQIPVEITHGAVIQKLLVKNLTKNLNTSSIMIAVVVTINNLITAEG